MIEICNWCGKPIDAEDDKAGRCLRCGEVLPPKDADDIEEWLTLMDVNDDMDDEDNPVDFDW